MWMTGFFGSVASSKWVPLSATMSLMESNSVICSFGVLLLLMCGFSVLDICFYELLQFTL